MGYLRILPHCLKRLAIYKQQEKKKQECQKKENDFKTQGKRDGHYKKSQQGCYKKGIVFQELNGVISAAVLDIIYS